VTVESSVLASTQIKPGSRLLVIKQERNVNPLQVNFFEGAEGKALDEQWYKYAVLVASTFKGAFWFSQLRRKLTSGPRHPNLWGSLARRLKRCGYKQTGRFRLSPIDTRQSGMESEWEKIKVK
jgi:hypothetical protein